MPQTEITVRYINEPKPGKKMGSIKDTNDNYYGVWPDKLHTYEVGKTYSIAYDEDHSNGRTFRNIKSNYGEVSRGGVAGATSTPAPSDDEKAADIFVTGVIGRAFHGTGQVPDKATCASMVRDLREGWKLGHESLSDSLNQAMQDTTHGMKALDDEIPF